MDFGGHYVDRLISHYGCDSYWSVVSITAALPVFSALRQLPVLINLSNDIVAIATAFREPL